jgi:SAM-dependent methyltransferase
LQIVQFNWPQYAVGLTALVAAALVTRYLPMPAALRWIVAAGAVVAAWWLLASLGASFWVYDLSPLARWNWLIEHLPQQSPRSCVLNIHSGFDDTTGLLREILPHARVLAVDLFTPRQMTEKSIHRARRAMPPLKDTIVAAPERIPLDSESADPVLLLLAAHELRLAGQREALFGEGRRILKPSGRLVVVEHARDLANFIAFGPGFMHFLPYAEWLRLADGANLRLVSVGRITPFVRYLVLEK